MVSDHRLLIQKDLFPSGNLGSEVELNKADPGKSAGGKTEGIKTNVENARA